MRKIDLTPYPIPEGEYDVKQSLLNVIYHPLRQLTAVQILQIEPLGKRILSSDGEILLEEAEWEQAVAGVNCLSGWSQHEIPFLHRVLNARLVPVVEGG